MQGGGPAADIGRVERAEPGGRIEVDRVDPVADGRQVRLGMTLGEVQAVVVAGRRDRRPAVVDHRQLGRPGGQGEGDPIGVDQQAPLAEPARSAPPGAR